MIKLYIYFLFSYYREISGFLINQETINELGEMTLNEL